MEIKNTNIRNDKEMNDINYNYFYYFNLDLNESSTNVILEKIMRKFRETSASIISRRFFELRNDVIEIMVNDSIYENNNYIPKRGGR